jgi:Ca2+-binding EF-hand superfamily protein
LIAWLALSLAAPLPAEDQPKNRNGLPLGEEKLTEEAETAAKELRSRFAPRTEARAMLDSIVSEPFLDSDSGWFAMAKSRTRFEWNEVAKRFDRNNDGHVDASELGGPTGDFARVDRNGDGLVDGTDLDWNTAPPPAASALSRMFAMSDANSNGKVTRDEFIKLFEQLKGDGEYLALDDVVQQFASSSPGSGQPEPLDRSMMVMALLHQELGALAPGPELNQSAPDFTLPRVGGGSVTLSKVIGKRPIVLIFGTFTCSPFRGQSGNLEKLYSRYQDRADFYLVYVREAHPSDGWNMEVNEAQGISFAQPKSNTERHNVAQTCQKHLDISVPMLVDTIDDQAGSAYSGMPNRLYVIDTQGKIAFKNARGPFGFYPRQLEQALVLLLNDSAQP